MTSQAGLRFAVVGAGAIGSVVAWRLAHAGAAVLLVGRGAHLAAIRRSGLRLSDEHGTGVHRIETCTACEAPDPHDVVVLATKAQDLPGAVVTARPLIGLSTAVVPAVNGLPWWIFQGASPERRVPAVDPDGALWSALGTSQILGAVVHMGASVPEPGHVVQAPRPRLILGEAGGAPPDRALAIAAVLAAGGLPTAVDPHIRDAVWSKLLGNIATNPLSVVTGATLDRLFHEPALLEIVRAQMAETLAVGAACGVRFEQDLDARIEIGRRLGPFRTSMLQDFDRGRPLELPAIATAVLDLAQALGIAMPVTRMVTELARAAETSARLRHERTT